MDSHQSDPDPRSITRRGFVLGGLGALLAACGSETATQVAGPTSGAAAPTASSGLDQLIAAAKQEGTLNTIALDNTWLNYGQMIAGFKQKYGLAVNELNPTAGSADEIEAVRAGKKDPGLEAPDVIDVGFAFGPALRQEGLIQPYKVSTWASIPNLLKDPDGYWYGDYYGVLAFIVNKDVVKTIPADWSDLLKPEYKGQVALAGDPKASTQAIQTVYAAALANGGSLDNAMPGLEFFAAVNKAGNLLPIIGSVASLMSGQTPIVIAWDYLGLDGRDKAGGKPAIEVVVPKSGVFGGVYVQAISAYAAHPNAAKLWMEYLYSDEGQLTWLRGYGHPVRYNDMVKRNAIPAELAAKLPPADLYARAEFASLDQLERSQKLITENWDKVVGLAIKQAG